MQLIVFLSLFCRVRGGGLPALALLLNTCNDKFDSLWRCSCLRLMRAIFDAGIMDESLAEIVLAVDCCDEAPWNAVKLFSEDA